MVEYHRPVRVFAGGSRKFFTSLLAVLFLFSFPFVSAVTPVSSDAIKLPVFLVIAGICLFLVLVGLGANIPFFSIVGFFLIFVMGFVIQAGNLYLPSGEVEYSYDNFTLPDGNVSTLISGEFSIYEAWNFGNYHFIGWFVMIVGLFASFFSVFATFSGGSD